MKKEWPTERFLGDDGGCFFFFLRVVVVFLGEGIDMFLQNGYIENPTIDPSPYDILLDGSCRVYLFYLRYLWYLECLDVCANRKVIVAQQHGRGLLKVHEIVKNNDFSVHHRHHYHSLDLDQVGCHKRPLKTQNTCSQG